MHLALAALLGFGILTLWVPGYWPVTVFQSGAFVLAGIVLWRRPREFAPFGYPVTPLLFAVLWGVFQWTTGLSAYAFETQRAVVDWMTYLAVALSALGILNEHGVRCKFRSVLLWFGFAVAIWATLQAPTSGGKVLWLFSTPYDSAVMGPILNRNHYAAFIELILPLALYEAMRNRGRAALFAGTAGVLYASVLASASRAGTVLATAEVLAVVTLMKTREREAGRPIAGAVLRIALSLALFTAVAGYQTVWNRFSAADPMMFRREFAISSVHMIKSHPWPGLGLGVWTTVYPRYAIVDAGAVVNQAHNDWLQWTAEGGIPFGLMMVSLFAWCLRPAIRTVWGLGVVAVFLHALVDFPFSRPALAAWTFTMVAMLAPVPEPDRIEADHGDPHSAANRRGRSSLARFRRRRISVVGSPTRPLADFRTRT